MASTGAPVRMVTPRRTSCSASWSARLAVLPWRDRKTGASPPGAEAGAGPVGPDPAEPVHQAPGLQGGGDQTGMAAAALELVDVAGVDPPDQRVHQPLHHRSAQPSADDLPDRPVADEHALGPGGARPRPGPRPRASAGREDARPGQRATSGWVSPGSARRAWPAAGPGPRSRRPRSPAPPAGRPGRAPGTGRWPRGAGPRRRRRPDRRSRPANSADRSLPPTRSPASSTWTSGRRRPRPSDPPISSQAADQPGHPRADDGDGRPAAPGSPGGVGSDTAAVAPSDRPPPVGPRRPAPRRNAGRRRATRVRAKATPSAGPARGPRRRGRRGPRGGRRRTRPGRPPPTVAPALGHPPISVSRSGPIQGSVGPARALPGHAPRDGRDASQPGQLGDVGGRLRHLDRIGVARGHRPLGEAVGGEEHRRPACLGPASSEARPPRCAPASSGGEARRPGATTGSGSASRRRVGRRRPPRRPDGGTRPIPGTTGGG